MEPCEFLDNCYFAKNSTDQVLKESYCNSNPLRCARFMIYQALGKEKVSDDLKPDEKMVAYQILAEN